MKELFAKYIEAVKKWNKLVAIYYEHMITRAILC